MRKRKRFSQSFSQGSGRGRKRGFSPPNSRLPPLILPTNDSSNNRLRLTQPHQKTMDRVKKLFPKNEKKLGKHAKLRFAVHPKHTNVNDQYLLWINDVSKDPFFMQFIILGSKKHRHERKHYHVSIRKELHCTCPDNRSATRSNYICKHILFVFFRILGFDHNNKGLTFWFNRYLESGELNYIRDHLPKTIEQKYIGTEREIVFSRTRRVYEQKK